MSAEIIKLVQPDNPGTNAPGSADKVLNAAVGRDFRDTLVIARAADGSLYFASTTSDMGDVLLLLKLAERNAMAMIG